VENADGVVVPSVGCAVDGSSAAECGCGASPRGERHITIGLFGCTSVPLRTRHGGRSKRLLKRSTNCANCSGACRRHPETVLVAGAPTGGERSFHHQLLNRSGRVNCSNCIWTS